MNLLPCPFCNGSPIQVVGNRNSYNYVGFIQCSKCEAQGEKFENKIDEFVKEESITAWNTRHTPWISVKDKLPEEDIKVLVIGGTCGITTANLGKFLPSGKAWYGYYEGFLGVVEGKNITHWMELPNLPETE